MDARNGRKRSWLARAIRFVIVASAALSLAYLAAGNAFLKFGGVELMFASTNTVSAKYGSAYTLWPGRVQVRDLRIVFQDHNLQWSLDFEKVTADIYLFELLRRTFHASAVRAEGGVFRMRHRIDPESKDEPWVGALAPIPEFPSPAVFEARVPEPPIPDDRYNLWRIHLENVDAGVKELWVHFIRYRGEGRARGAFELLPARRLWVGPASLDLAPGPVQLGDAPLGAALSGRIECVVDSFDVRVPVGREVFRYISTELKLHGKGFRPAAMLQLFELRSEVAFDTEPGEVEVSASLKRGHVRPGSQVSFTTATARLQASAASVKAEGVRVAARMAAGARGEASLSVERVELAREPGAPLAGEATRASANVVTRGDDTAGEMELSERGVELESVKIADARALNAFIGSSRRRFVSGKLEGRLSASELGQARRAELAVKASDLNAEWDGTALSLNAELIGSGASGEKSPRDVELAMHGQIGRLRWKRRGLTQVPPFLLELGNAALDVDVGRKKEGGSRGQLKLEAARLSLRATLGDAANSASFRGIVLDASARELGARVSGELALRAEQAELSVGSRAIRSKPDLHVTLDGFDFEKLGGRVESALRLTDLVATHGDPTGQCSTIRAPEARLTFDGRAVEGKLDASAVLDVTRAKFDWGDFEATADARVGMTLRELGLESGVGRMALVAEVTDPSLRSGSGANSGWLATAPKISAKLDAWTGPVLLGSLSVDAADVRGRIGGTELRSDFAGRLPVVSFDLAQRTARFSGEFQLTRTEVSAERALRDWWARIEVRSGLVIARENLDLSALFSARLRDVGPGVEILNAGGALPGWLTGLAPMDPLIAEGMVKRRCRLTEIQLTRAVDGPVALRGRLQSVSEAVRGAFLVRLGAAEMVSAGVAFDPSETDVALLAGDGWFKEQSQALDQVARNVLERSCVAPSESCGVD